MITPVYFCAGNEENGSITPLQRFHTTSELPGLSTGHVTAHQIVQRNGDFICVESGVNEGATLYFNLQ